MHFQYGVTSDSVNIQIEGNDYDKSIEFISKVCCKLASDPVYHFNVNEWLREIVDDVEYDIDDSELISFTLTIKKN